MSSFLLWLLFGFAVAYDFSDYLSEFNKSYHFQEQYLMRKSFFQANYSSIIQFNSLNKTYKLSVSFMTDWSQAEVDRFLGTKEDLSHPGQTLPVKSQKVAATTVDWRKLGGVTPVKQQGSCGSCWAFTAAAAYQSLLKIRLNKTYDLSEEYLLECTPNSDCTGGYIEEAFSMLTQKSPQGLPQQSKYPYKGLQSGSITPTTKDICKTKQKVTDKLRFQYHKYSNVSTEQLKELLTDSTVGIGIYANDKFPSYKSGVFFCEPKIPPNYPINHAVELIGYDAQGWIIKNSWGTTWGEQGFGRVSFDGNCGIGFAVYQLTSSIGKGGPMLYVGAMILLVILFQ